MGEKDFLVELRNEIEIEAREHKAINELFKSCYGSYPQDRSFYHQVPTFRYLVWADKILVANLSVTFRYISTDQNFIPVFGLSEFCVMHKYQNKGIGQGLLERLKSLAQSKQVPLIVAVTDNSSFYEHAGFQKYSGSCKWLFIQGDQSIGVLRRSIDSSVYLFSLDGKVRDIDEIDFLGTMF